MRRLMIMCLMFFRIVSSDCLAQQTGMEKMLHFLGAASAEEADGYEVERISEFLERPLKINVESSGRIRESGLLTHYQIASLADYRARHGDVLSLAELASVDGFGEDFAALISPFISFESRMSPGVRSKSDSLNLRHDLSMKTALKKDASVTYGLKYRLEAGERLEAGFAFSRSASADRMYPDGVSAYVRWDLKRIPATIVAGDFNARFGQGLALWNGMRLSGISSPSSYLKRSAGVAPSSSYTGNYSLKGVAGYILPGRNIKLSSFLAVKLPEDAICVMPGINLTVLHKTGTFGITHYADMAFSIHGMNIPDMKTSADAAWCLGGKDFFAELAYDWVMETAAGIAGTVLPAGDNCRLAFMTRFYPASYSSDLSAAAGSSSKCSNEYGLSASAELMSRKWVSVNGKEGFGSSVRRHASTFSFDASYYPEPKSDESEKSIQIKVAGEWGFMITSALKLKLRLTERLRSWGDPFRTDARADITYMSKHLSAGIRLNVLRCVSTSFLSYAEVGFSIGKLSSFFRQGIFLADEWEDRIYAYERDGPGSFNVPAYYGRGFWSAFTLSWRYSRWGKLFLRAAATTYPLMKEEKPGKAELRLYMSFDL